ncbi:hypothetical protein L1987_72181 [Smallanthus sonchifolius]|uniref:Uncharacterized protein n=1 Tax=Smallanthus sonchifolius TaxID=185202 RepID=A0ACB9AUI0_9ASTR|nr:hypothetical protein L1987_72181 [Smallanthus sonchifolius]
MVKMDDQLQTHTSSLPLLSKPDRMESFNECVPLKTTVVEAKNKSYLLGRIESLEDRLIQLSLEIETRQASRTSATASTLSGARELPVSSYPVFNNPKSKCKLASSSDILPISSGGELQNEPETLEKKQKQTRKKKAQSWPHLKILGC